MPLNAPILRAVPEFGPPNARRYAILNVATGELWTGKSFQSDRSQARLYSEPNLACVDMREILVSYYDHLPLRRYRAPVEIEVYGSVTPQAVAWWLSRASLLCLRTTEYGNGPHESYVAPTIHWGLVEEIDRPFFSIDDLEEDFDG